MDMEKIRQPQHMEVSWNGGTLKFHPFFKRFSIVNHPAIGIPHWWKPPQKRKPVSWSFQDERKHKTACFFLWDWEFSRIDFIESMIQLLAFPFCGAFHQWGIPIAGWFTIENPIKNGWKLRLPPFQETSFINLSCRICYLKDLISLDSSTKADQTRHIFYVHWPILRQPTSKVFRSILLIYAANPPKLTPTSMYIYI